MGDQRSTAEESFGITNDNGVLALKPASSFKAWRNVIKDKDLTWGQMIMGKNAMLHHTNN